MDPIEAKERRKPMSKLVDLEDPKIIARLRAIFGDQNGSEVEETPVPKKSKKPSKVVTFTIKALVIPNYEWPNGRKGTALWYCDDDGQPLDEQTWNAKQSLRNAPPPIRRALKVPERD